MKVATRQLLLLIGVCFIAVVGAPSVSVASPTSPQNPSPVPTQTPAPKSSPKVLKKNTPSQPSWRRALWPALLDAASAHKAVAAVTVVIVLLACLWSVLLWAYPLGLLAILRTSDLGEFTLWGLKFRALEYALLLPLFAYRERVLDAWLEDCLPHARKFFQEREIQKGREVWVELAVKLNGDVIRKLSPADLKPIFLRETVQMLIHGEGGAGKTSLACHIAYWGMSENRELRLRPHYMLSLLIDHNFIQNAQTDDVLEPLAVELERVSG